MARSQNNQRTWALLFEYRWIQPYCYTGQHPFIQISYVWNALLLGHCCNVGNQLLFYTYHSPVYTPTDSNCL